MLEIKGLKVIRGDFNVALPELYIADGQCVALCGVSGSGKSTLMEAIGLLSPYLSLDNFILDNIAVDELSPKDQDALRISEIGIMPQVGGLLPFLTIRENIALQIELALKKKIVPVYPNIAQDKPIPNTTVALQEAHERSAMQHQQAQELKKEQGLRKTKKLFRRFNNGLLPVKLVNEKLEKEHEQAKKHEYVSPYEMMVKDMEQVVDSIDAHCLDGATVNSQEEQDRKLALIPKKKRHYARSIKISNEYTKERVQSQFDSLHTYIDRLGLTDHLDKLPHELSIGQRQRALFIRSIAHGPKLLLIDEPTSALDPDNAKVLFKLIEEIASQTHISVLIITHDTEAVSNYCRYEYDTVNSKPEHSVFVSAHDNRVDAQLDSVRDQDITLMAEMTIDYPAASGLNRSYNEISVNNTVQKSEDNVYHEIVHIFEHNSGEHLNNGYAYEQGHHLHYGYAHHTNHYHNNMLTNLEANDYQSKVSKHLGGYTKINDRISHYSTPIDRLQTLLRKNNSQNEDQSGRDA